MNCILLTNKIGVHGRPYIPWDNVSGANNEGYCTHSSILFPPWHRPYLALFEVLGSTTYVEVLSLIASSKSFGIMLRVLPTLTLLPNVVAIKQPRET